MGSCFYNLTVAAILRQVAATFGSVEPVQAPQGNLVQHLVFMCREMEKWPRTTQNAFKAGRWIGWMLRDAELLGLWNNEASRTFIRLDVNNKSDQPDRGSLWSKLRSALERTSLASIAGGEVGDENLAAMLDSVANMAVDTVLDNVQA